MLKDATGDEFDVILAWHEERLYRGLRSKLTVLEIAQDYKIEMLLAKVFRGELVEQDAEGESAETLLERIRSQWQDEPNKVSR